MTKPQRIKTPIKRNARIFRPAKRSKMAAKLILFIALLSYFAILVHGRGRGSFSIGSTYGAHLIYHEVHHKFPIPLIKRDEDFTVKTGSNEFIHAVIVNDLKGNGLSYMKEGGIGQHQVKIHLEGKRGGGYKFLVEVYAI